MNYREFGKENSKTILLLHGGGLSWWNYRDETDLLQSDYHVILPILDGHAGSDRPFTSIEDNASEIISFIDENCSGGVLLIGGLSLGAQILLEILSRRSDICRYALIESAAVIPSGITHALIGPAFGGSYGLIKNRAFSRLQFNALHIKPELFEDYYRDTCAVRKSDMIAFMKANTAYSLKNTVGKSSAGVFVFAGEKETGQIRRSVSAIHSSLPECRTFILPGLHHGELSINYPEKYVHIINSIVSGKGVQI